MQQNPRIKVHTSIAPSNEAVKTDKKIRWRVLPQARGQSAQRKRIARRRAPRSEPGQGTRSPSACCATQRWPAR